LETVPGNGAEVIENNPHGHMDMHHNDAPADMSHPKRNPWAAETAALPSLAVFCLTQICGPVALS
jgi:hypothetical protein